VWVTSSGSLAPHATLPSESQKAATPRAMFPQIFGKYVLEREIGAGGMARVYLATLRGAGGFEKRLVLKQIRAELASDQAFVRRFVEEAKTAVELSHSNIVPVYELGVEQGVYYIAMEFCSGVTLSEMLAATGALDPFEGAYVGVEICRALDYAHRRAGIVHRDVTPRNVLIDDEGAVRLIDFGIAAPVSTGDERGPREIFGSPGHMPPEQLAGARLSPATDVFAVAVLLFEAWTLEPPFRRRTAEESARALEGPPPVLAERAPELAPLSPLLLAALARDPAARPKSADDLARPLREFLKPADLGDLARKLGDRVQKTRARAAASTGAEEQASGDAAATPVALERTPPLVTEVTRTFAAREEWTAWSRQIETRPSERPAAEPSAGPRTRRLSDPKTLAPQAAGAPRPRARRLAAGGVFALGLGVVAALGLAPERSSAPPNPPPEARAPAPRTDELPRAPAEPTSSATAPSSSATAPPLPSSAPPPRSSAAPKPKAQATASAPASVATAMLRLTADPPAEVTVHGEGITTTLTTPVRALSLKPGTYRVTFRNATYGPPVATRVTLHSGHAQVVHADFREAEPRVTVR
jgi:serine/threonine protein kinase